LISEAWVADATETQIDTAESGLAPGVRLPVLDGAALVVFAVTSVGGDTAPQSSLTAVRVQPGLAGLQLTLTESDNALTFDVGSVRAAHSGRERRRMGGAEQLAYGSHLSGDSTSNGYPLLAG
jgi:hypothetical protein